MRDFLSSFFRLAHLALQNVNKDYVIFSYFRNFVAKSDQKPKTKNGMNERILNEDQELKNIKLFSYVGVGGVKMIDGFEEKEI